MGTQSNTFGLTAEVINKISGVLSNYSAIKIVLIYGSRAKGNYQQGSDIDLCIVGGPVSFSDISTIETSLDDLLLPYKIDLTEKDKIDNPDLLNHIERVGKNFYIKD